MGSGIDIYLLGGRITPNMHQQIGDIEHHPQIGDFRRDLAQCPQNRLPYDPFLVREGDQKIGNGSYIVSYNFV